MLFVIYLAWMSPTYCNSRQNVFDAYGQNGIEEGMYFLEFQSELEVLNLSGEPYNGNVWFTKEPVFYGVVPDSLKTNELLTTPVCVSGWNIAGQDWVVKVYDESGTMVKQYPAMKAVIQDENGLESLPEFNLPDLEAGVYWLEICKTDGEQVGTVLFWVEEPDASDLVINTDALPGAIVGKEYNFNLNAEGGTPPYVWSLAAGSILPPGLTISAEGEISGVPTEAGTYNITIQVKDAAEHITMKKIVLEVHPEGTAVIIPKIVLNKNDLAQGEEFSVAVQLTNIKNGDKTNSASFELIYDSNAFELATGDPKNDIVNGYLAFAHKSDTPVSESLRKVAATFLAMDDELLQEGEAIFTVKLKVKQDAPQGEKNFQLNCGDMLDTDFNSYNINFGQPVTTQVNIVAGGVLEGYLNIYLGDGGSGLNKLLLSKLQQEAINETFAHLQFTLKKDAQDPGIVIKGQDVFVPDENGNLAVLNGNNLVTGKFSFKVTDLDKTILNIGGVGYLQKDFNLSLAAGQVFTIGNEGQPEEFYPGDLGKVDQGLKLIPDGKVNNVDFSAWLKIFKDSQKGIAEPMHLLNADMTKDGKVDNLDFSLWLMSYKKILTLP
jgi:hypothetical protein